jgi:glycosyltransferase involved in cell wall biosynthesis
MLQERVSVIVTTYNSSATIVRTLESITSQLAENDELLIYDDCSSDETVHLVLDYLKDISLHYELEIGTINFGGPAKGRNWGIRNSTGSFICFCDADDQWLEGKLTAQVNFLVNSKYDFLGTSCRVIGSKQFPQFVGEVGIYSQLLRNKFVLSTIMFKAGCLRHANLFFDERSSYHGVEDYELLLRLISRKFRGYVSALSLVNYYHISTSISHLNVKNSELKRISVLRNFDTTNLLQCVTVEFITNVLTTRIVYNELRDYFRKF